MSPFDLGTGSLSKTSNSFVCFKINTVSPFNGFILWWSMNANVVLFNGNWLEVIKRKQSPKKAGFWYQPNMVIQLVELQLFLFSFLQYLWDLERPMMVSFHSLFFSIFFSIHPKIIIFHTCWVCPVSYSNNTQGQMSKLTACSQQHQHSVNRLWLNCKT